MGRKTGWMITIVFWILVFGFPAMADVGPKPEINIAVLNFPEEEYYLDLLIVGEASEHLYQNLNRSLDEIDPVLIELLKQNRETGWHLGITDGTNIPMSGKLTGEENDEKMFHRFGYVGVPNSFKVIVVTKDGTVKISSQYDRKSFVSNMVYDFHENTLRTRSPIALAYLLQFVTTCIPTLLIEGILLIGFGFSGKKNWIVFLGANITTQVFLTAILGTTLIRSGLLAAILLQIPVELGILVMETIAYTFLLEGRSRGRRIGYGITANLCTWVLGFFMVTFQYMILEHIT